jgi:UDP-N-acetylglucosamine 3-dehydrogenase
MGQDHARIIETLNEAKVVVVVEPNQRNLDLARERFSGEEVSFYSDVTTALSQSNLDGWIVSSSTSSHVEITRILLESGSKVLLEKPIAESMQSALELQDHVAPESSNLMMGHILLWSDEFTTLVNKVQGRGQIKDINAMRPRSASHRTDYPNESPFSLLMVHDLYCIYVLMSGADPISISGESFIHERGGEDRAIGRLEWAGGIAAVAESNYLIPDENAPHVHDVLSVGGADWQERTEYTGNFDFALRNELEFFLSVLRGEAEVPLGARYSDAVKIQGWVDQLMASSRQSKNKGD